MTLGLLEWTLGVATKRARSARWRTWALPRATLFMQLGRKLDWSEFPTVLSAILRFIGKRNGQGGDFHKPLSQLTRGLQTVGSHVVEPDGAPGQRFAEEVTSGCADWTMVKKDRKRLIASLELLGTLVALKLWLPAISLHVKGVCQVYGGTDNQRNSYAISKCMSTKYPLTLLVMEISETLRTRDCELHLQWVWQDKNQLADDLTNGVHASFKPESRLRWSGDRCPWIVLQRFLEHARAYHEELVKEKSPGLPRKKESKKGKAKLEKW